MAKERAKIVMSLLGLANCSETIIGDHTHRGVRCPRTCIIPGFGVAEYRTE